MATRLENFAYLKKGLNVLLTMPNHGLKELQYYALSLLSGTLEPQPTGYFQLPTAFGKTHLLAALAKAYQAQPQSEKIVIVVPTIDLVEQTYEKLKQDIEFTDIGAFYKDTKDTQNKIIVTTYTSLEKLEEKVSDIGLILLDEAHHVLSDKRQALFKTHFQNACVYGMTATPAYSNNKNLSYFLDEPIVNLGIKECIHAGILCSVNSILLESKFQLDLSQVKKSSSGDWDEKLYQKALIKATGRNNQTAIDEAFRLNGQGAWEVAHRLICDEIADFYLNFVDPNTLEKINGKPCLINCRTQREAEIQALALNEKAGKKIAGVWTTDNQSVGTLESFKKGKFPVLCQVGKLNEGFDFPKLSLCINYPTSSFVTEHQRSGRILRIDPDNPMKKAVVVDIVFSHPNATKYGAFASAKMNQQVLFSDVIQNTEFVTLSQRAYELKLRKQRSSKILPSLTLANFNIYATPQKLLELRNEGLKWIHEIKIPTKRAGMLTATKTCIKLSSTKYYRLFSQKFEEAANQGDTFIDIDGIEKPLIERYKSTHGTIPYLHESPKALQEFVKRYGNELHLPNYIYQKIVNNQEIPLKRAGMLSATKTCIKLSSAKYHKLFTQKFEEAANQGITFIDNDGIEKPLIEHCISSHRTTSYLHESPKALQEFVKRYGKELHIPDYIYQEIINNQKIPTKREGMLTASEICNKLGRSAYCKLFSQKFEVLANQGVTFIDIDGIEKPLIKRFASTRGATFYLHESPKALQEFVKQYGNELHISDYTYQKIVNNQKTPLKRKGMLTATETCKKLGRTNHNRFFSQKFEVLANQGVTFIDIDGIEKPLIERYLSGHIPAFYLHESPKALQEFVKQYGNELHVPDYTYQKIVNNQKIPLKRAGMLTATKTCKKLGRSNYCKLFSQKFEESANQGVTFIDIDGIEKPLIKRYDSTYGTTLYLHESPKALQEFVKQYGNELHVPDYIYHGIINNQEIPLKRKGMLTAGETSKKLGKARYCKLFSQKFKVAVNQGVTFIDIDGIEKPLIERCLSFHGPAFYLHESPKALQEFVKRYGEKLHLSPQKMQIISNLEHLKKCLTHSAQQHDR